MPLGPLLSPARVWPHFSGVWVCPDGQALAVSPPTPGTAPGGSLSAGTQARRCAGLVKGARPGVMGVSQEDSQAVASVWPQVRRRTPLAATPPSAVGWVFTPNTHVQLHAGHLGPRRHSRRTAGSWPVEGTPASQRSGWRSGGALWKAELVGVSPGRARVSGVAPRSRVAGVGHHPQEGPARRGPARPVPRPPASVSPHRYCY